MFFESVVNSVKSARGHSPPKRLSASLLLYGSAHCPYLTSLYRRKVTLCFSVTVLNISNTQLCFTSPWLSDSTHFIPITTLLISFPLLCHSLPSHRLSTPFHRFTSHFNTAALLRHSDTKLLLCTTPLRHSKTFRNYAQTWLVTTMPVLSPAVRLFAFPALRISAPFRIITPLRLFGSVRYFSEAILSNSFPGPLFASPAPYTATLCRNITVFSFPRLYGLCYATPALNNSFAFPNYSMP